MKRMSFYSSKNNAPFSPVDLVMLRQWYKASIATKDGSNRVSQWDDLSGNGNHLTASGGTMPLWVDGVFDGKPIIRFVFYPYTFFTFPNYSSNPFTNDSTMFMVVKRPGTGGADTILSFISPGSANIYFMVSNTVGYMYDASDGPTAYFDGGIATTNICCTINVGSSTGFKTYWNNVAIEAAMPHIKNQLLPNFGGDNSWWGSGNFDIAELIYYNRKLDDTERDQVYAYLKTQYPSLT